VNFISSIRFDDKSVKQLAELQKDSELSRSAVIRKAINVLHESTMQQNKETAAV